MKAMACLFCTIWSKAPSHLDETSSIMPHRVVNVFAGLVIVGLSKTEKISSQHYTTAGDMV